jgi:hypothetical protein
VKLPIVSLLLAGALVAQRPGNFIIRFEPKAILQTNVQVPFDITVTNDIRQPLRQAKVTLQIETKDHQKVQIFKAPEARAGLYVAKPVFPDAGTWSVYVEVRRNDEITTRTLDFNVSAQ